MFKPATAIVNQVLLEELTDAPCPSRNNDVEGWHHGLNRRCHGKTQLPFYVLIQLLHEEAKLVSLQIRLVSERKLKRMQRSVYRQLQSRIFTLWEEYKSGERTSKQLLRACARLYGPRDI